MRYDAIHAGGCGECRHATGLWLPHHGMHRASGVRCRADAGLVASVSDCPACRTWHWPAITLVVIYGPVALVVGWVVWLIWRCYEH